MKKNTKPNKITFATRMEIERLLNKGFEIKEIQKKVGICKSTLYYERARCHGEYNAKEAQENAIGRRKLMSLQMHERKEAPPSVIVLKSLTKVLKNLEVLYHSGVTDSQKVYLEETIKTVEWILGADKAHKNPLPQEKIEELYSLLDEGKSHHQICLEMGISRSTVFYHKKNKGQENKTQNKPQEQSIEDKYDELIKKWT